MRLTQRCIRESEEKGRSRGKNQANQDKVDHGGQRRLEPVGGSPRTQQESPSTKKKRTATDGSRQCVQYPITVSSLPSGRLPSTIRSFVYDTATQRDKGQRRLLYSEPLSRWKVPSGGRETKVDPVVLLVPRPGRRDTYLRVNVTGTS